MKLVLTLRAEADLDAIAAYIYSRHPAGARQVEAEIQGAFRLIEAYPLVGHETRRGVRRLALPRYPYLIFYGLDEAADAIRVFTVRHGARRPKNWEQKTT